jgi:predicted RNA-binding Zn-ribbon protein involved in translation (DUF1610 family)
VAQDPSLTQAIRRAAAQQAMTQKAVETDQSLIDRLGITKAGKLLPCPICGKDKWKTRLRGSVYVCRTCGYEREAEETVSPSLTK